MTEPKLPMDICLISSMSIGSISVAPNAPRSWAYWEFCREADIPRLPKAEVLILMMELQTRIFQSHRWGILSPVSGIRTVTTELPQNSTTILKSLLPRTELAKALAASITKT